MIKKTHEEYLELAKTLGRHIGCELILDPASRALALTLHFVTDKPRCPMCLEQAIESVPGNLPNGR